MNYDQHTGDGGAHLPFEPLHSARARRQSLSKARIVASMSIPWGETKGDNDLGGYHLVWTRDLVQSATALLATGQTGTPRGP